MPYRVQVNGEFNGHIDRISAFNVSDETRQKAKLPETKAGWNKMTQEEVEAAKESIVEVVRSKFSYGGYIYVAGLTWWSGKERSIHLKEI